MGQFKRELSVALAYAVLLGILAWKAPAFYQGSELRNQVVKSSPVLVAAVGMTLVILARHIDISIGAQLSICGVVTGLLAKAGLPMPLAAIGAMLAGAAMGSLNGFFVAVLGLPSIVVTLATWFIFGDSLSWWRQGEFVRGLPNAFQWFGQSQTVGQEIVVGVAAAMFLIFAWGLRYVAAGRAVYATGSEPENAFLVGVRPKRVVFSVFVLMGALTGLASVLEVVQLPQVDPTAGKGLELEVIAAVVVGGVAVSGGRGTLIGVLFGVALLSTIEPALVFFKIDSSWEKVFEGAIILIAVASDAFNFKRRRHGLGTVAA
ncbi:MAG TPA: ABC transporter permease [Pirellulales bacterium]|jgi:rhamnose transport system permease protein|nr:ABC transporter permease [Pirellulales bacterium]